MSNVRRIVPGRLADTEDLGGWILVGLVVAYIVGVCWWRVVGIGPGVGFLPAWTAVAFASLVIATWLTERSGRHLRPLEASLLIVVPAMVLTDLSQWFQPLRDFGIYLKAGEHFMSGAPVYLQSTIDTRPADLTNYPFLYPPLTLPFFGLLSLLPVPVAQAMWVSGSLALGALALRVMGLRWRWILLAPLWPPLFQGLWVGNVSVPALALFALAPRFGSGLVVGAVFKSYTGLATLWLIRERRFLELIAGAVAVLAVVLATLPLTGIHLWLDWLQALRLYQVSQHNLPALYGFGLSAYVPLWTFLLIAAAAVAAALTVGGREGLARIGTATIVASPSLWGHGVLMAVPSLLFLAPAWLWLGLGVTAVPDGIQWWWLVVLIGSSWLLPWLRRDAAATAPDATPAAADWLDPLVAGGTGPWPGLADRERRGVRAGNRRPAVSWGSRSESESESVAE